MTKLVDFTIDNEETNSMVKMLRSASLLEHVHFVFTTYEHE